jgi:hypothetical protein
MSLAPPHHETLITRPPPHLKAMTLGLAWTLLVYFIFILPLWIRLC